MSDNNQIRTDWEREQLKTTFELEQKILELKANVQLWKDAFEHYCTNVEDCSMLDEVNRITPEQCINKVKSEAIKYAANYLWDENKIVKYTKNDLTRLANEFLKGG